MGAVVHRWLVSFSGLLTGLGALIATPGWEPLGIPATVGVGCSFAAAATILVATFIRQATDPRPA